MKVTIKIKKGLQRVSFNVMKIKGIPFLENDLYWEGKIINNTILLMK